MCRVGGKSAYWINNCVRFSVRNVLWVLVFYLDADKSILVWSLQQHKDSSSRVPYFTRGPSVTTISLSLCLSHCISLLSFYADCSCICRLLFRLFYRTANGCTLSLRRIQIRVSFLSHLKRTTLILFIPWNMKKTSACDCSWTAIFLTSLLI